jgi:hypothetical protein
MKIKADTFILILVGLIGLIVCGMKLLELSTGLGSVAVALDEDMAKQRLFWLLGTIGSAVALLIGILNAFGETAQTFSNPSLPRQDPDPYQENGQMKAQFRARYCDMSGEELVHILEDQTCSNEAHTVAFEILKERERVRLGAENLSHPVQRN